MSATDFTDKSLEEVCIYFCEKHSHEGVPESREAFAKWLSDNPKECERLRSEMIDATSKYLVGQLFHRAAGRLRAEGVGGSHTFRRLAKGEESKARVSPATRSRAMLRLKISEHLKYTTCKGKPLHACTRDELVHEVAVRNRRADGDAKMAEYVTRLLKLIPVKHAGKVRDVLGEARIDEVNRVWESVYKPESVST